ncbi:hypothetical protein JQC91_12675 [Jannaschia sp. Os4]|uniref:glycosyltransferase n=1 Tax=Jannaschia sp. Os4 TaxID=2807617 RepID=UPI00193A6880|nr:glycosyltransferase [Jannaschia sp. Os4]MBM2577155.1 hypothetical protein [Jannaschia sp. Os4]
MTTANAIVGVLRFSYPAKEGFSVSCLDEAELEAHLYAPERMQARFEYLERIALPSLAAQTDMGFACVILAGKTLPWRFKARLRALEERHPFLRVAFMERMGALAAAKRSFRRGLEMLEQASGSAATHCTGFRMDDDDAVAVDYVAKTRARADALLGAGLADAPTVVAFARGIYWDLHEPALPYADFREPQPLGLACAMITTADLPTCVYRYNHRKLPGQVPTFMDPEGFMFLRTLHGHNDSGRSIPPHAKPLPLGRARGLIRERFALDPADLEALMPDPPLEAS